MVDYLRELDNSRTAEHVEFDPIRILKKSNIKIGPYPTVQYEVAQYAAPSFTIEAYFDATPHTIVRLSLARIDANITESMRQLNDQILSTFRFID